MVVQHPFTTPHSQIPHYFHSWYSDDFYFTGIFHFSSAMSLNLVATKNLLTVVDGKLVGVQQVHGRVVLGGPRFIISPSASRVSSQFASASPNRPVANGNPHVSRVSQSSSALPNRVVAIGSSRMKTSNQIVVSNPSTGHAGGNPKHALITITPNQSTNGLAIPSTNSSVAASPKPLAMPVLTKHDHPYSTLESAEIVEAPRLTKANNAADGKEGVPIAKPPRLTSGISKANQITKAQPRLLTRSPKTKKSAGSDPSFAQLKVKFAWNSRRISSSSDKNGVKSDETEDATKRPGPSSCNDDVPLPSLSDLRSDDKILRVALTRLGGKTLKRLGCDISSPLYTSLITDKSKSLSRKPAAVDDADVDKTGDLACLVGVTTSPLKRKAVAVDEHHEDVKKTRDLSKKSFEPDRRSSRFTTSTLKRKPVAVDEDVDTDVEKPGDISKSFEPDHRISRLTTSILKRKPAAVDEDVDADVEKTGDLSKKSFEPDRRSSRLTTSTLKRKAVDVDADVNKTRDLSKSSFEADRRSSRLTTSTLKRKPADVDADVEKTGDLSKKSFEPDRRSSRLTTSTLKRKAVAVGEDVKKTRDLSTKSFEPDRRSSRSTTSTLKRKAVAVGEDVKKTRDLSTKSFEPDRRSSRSTTSTLKRKAVTVVKKARDLSTDEPDRRSSKLTISTLKRKTGVVEVDDVKQTRDRSSFEPGRSLRLNTLIKLPDSKHIPTNDKVAYLKELLRSQKAMLGM